MGDRLYRSLLKIYPAPFRRDFETRLVELFRYRRMEARERGGPLWRLRFWKFIGIDLIRSAWAEWRGATAPHGSPTPTPSPPRGGFVESGFRDLFYSIRRLLRSPGFTLASLAILSLAIGINTTAFSIVNSMLFQPPPFPESDRVVEVLQDSDGGDPSSTSYPAYLDIREYEAIFSSVGARAFTTTYVDLGDGQVIPAPAEFATSSYLTVIGLQPFIGRWFEGAEDVPEGPPAVVLSYRYWKNVFGGDPEVVGDVVRLNGAAIQIVGVGPEHYFGGIGLETVAFWLSISSLDETNGPVQSLTRRQDHPMRVVGRLESGVSVAEAQEAMNGLADRLANDFPDMNRDRRIHVLPMQRVGAENRGSVLPMAALLLGLAGLVLFVASINLANLMLVRGMSREREIGVRRALGGTRGRLVRVISGETLVLVVGGTGIGLLLTYLLMTWLGTLELALDGPATLDIRLDMRVLLFSLATAGGASLIAGLVPALRILSPTLDTLVRERRAREGRGKGRVAGGLVSLQVAGSLILLVSAGLFIESAIRANTADPGFRSEGTVVVGLDLNPMGSSGEEVVSTYDRLRERVAAMPEVSSVTFTRNLPATASGTTTLLLGDLVDGRRRPIEVRWNQIRSGYFSVLGIPLLHGRDFDDRDRGDVPTRVVVNRAMAETFWGRTDVVGERYVSENAPDQPVEIIGVVETTKVASMEESPTPLVYFDGQRSAGTRYNLLARAEGPELSALAAVRNQIQSFDPRIMILRATTMDEYLSSTLGPQRLIARILTGIGGFALLLAAFGIYGVVSYNVSRRIPEVGIRMTLGAERATVMGLFLKDTGVLVGIGVVLGIALAIPLARVVGSEFTGVQGTPALVVIACTSTLIIAAVLATGIPARRAVRLNPAQTLRNE